MEIRTSDGREEKSVKVCCCCCGGGFCGGSSLEVAAAASTFALFVGLLSIVKKVSVVLLLYPL